MKETEKNCGNCIHLDVCKHVHNPLLHGHIEAIAKIAKDMFGGDEAEIHDRIENAIWEALEPSIKEGCTEFLPATQEITGDSNEQTES